MKKRLYVSLGAVHLPRRRRCLALTLLTGAAEPEGRGARRDAPKTAASRIVAVTVYQPNALVTREVEVPDGTGLMELVVTPLPDAASQQLPLLRGHRRHPRADHALPHPRRQGGHPRGGPQARSRAAQAQGGAAKDPGRHEGARAEHGPAHQAGRLHHGHHRHTPPRRASSTATRPSPWPSTSWTSGPRRPRRWSTCSSRLQTNAEQMAFVTAAAARVAGRHEQDRARRGHRRRQDERAPPARCG